jgi:hypothetical protein
MTTPHDSCHRCTFAFQPETTPLLPWRAGIASVLKSGFGDRNRNTKKAAKQGPRKIFQFEGAVVGLQLAFEPLLIGKVYRGR